MEVIMIETERMFTFQISEDQYQMINEIKNSTGKSLKWILKQALSDYIDRDQSIADQGVRYERS